MESGFILAHVNILFKTYLLFQELSIKTKELISNTKSLAPPGEKLTLEVLRARKMTPAQETFLYTLAAVEGFAQL